MFYANQFRKFLPFSHFKENAARMTVPPNDSFSDKWWEYRPQTCLVTPRSVLRNPHESLLHLEVHVPCARCRRIYVHIRLACFDDSSGKNSSLLHNVFLPLLNIMHLLGIRLLQAGTINAKFMPQAFLSYIRIIPGQAAIWFHSGNARMILQAVPQCCARLLQTGSLLASMQRL